MKTDRQELLDLARDVIEVGQAQRAYWDSGRTPAERDKVKLGKSKKLEAALKAKAEAILVPPKPTLFDAGEEHEPPRAA